MSENRTKKYCNTASCWIYIGMCISESWSPHDGDYQDV